MAWGDFRDRYLESLLPADWLKPKREDRMASHVSIAPVPFKGDPEEDLTAFAMAIHREIDHLTRCLIDGDDSRPDEFLRGAIKGLHAAAERLSNLARAYSTLKEPT